MVELMAQLAALSASNAALLSQVALLQPGAQAPAPTSFARTPAFTGQTDLLDFRKKADLSVYAEGKSQMFKGGELFDVKMETLRHLLKRLHKKATDQGLNNANNLQKLLCSMSRTTVPSSRLTSPNPTAALK